MSALASRSRDAALELHRLLRDMDPARVLAMGRDRLDQDRASLVARARALSTRFHALRGEVKHQDDRHDRNAAERGVGATPDEDPDEDWVEPIASRVDEVATMLRAAPNVAHENPSAWQGYRKDLIRAYEDLGRALRQASVEVPSVRPTNYTRSIVHATMALVCVVLIEQVLTPTQRWLVPLAAAVSFWGMEAWRHTSDTGRRVLLWVFGPIAHPHERHRINSGTYFVTALALLGGAFPAMACAVGVAILGFADPAAGFVGRKWGRIKLINQRSLAGTSAFFVVGTVVALGVLNLWHGDLAWSARLAIAVTAALFGSLGELFSNRIVDDNFAVPLSAALGASLALHLCG
ncbi:MAG: hypothetical protein AAGN82_26210 [Myxococcota bacterium]